MLYQTAGFALAKQSAKATAATTNFIRGRMSSHGVNPVYDEIDPSGEHTGIHQRSTALQSTPIRSGYMADISLAFRLYPNLVGYALAGIGFGNTTATTVILTIDATGGTFTITVSAQTTSAIAFDAAIGAVETAIELLSTVTAATVTGTASNYTITVDSGVTSATMTANAGSLTGGGTTATYTGWYYTHTFTLADAEAESWVSLMSAVGEDSARYERKITDARLSQLVFAASRTGIDVTGTASGLSEATSAGSETVVQETDSMLSQAQGAFTVTSSDITAVTLGTPRSHTLTIDNPLDDQEQNLHSFSRATLSPTGKVISGTLEGLVFSENIYKEFIYGASGGTAPVIPIPEAQLVWSFTSPAFITGAIANSFQATIPTAQVMMDPFDVTAGGQIIYNARYRMIDNAASAPITIVLINSTSSYAGS